MSAAKQVTTIDEDEATRPKPAAESVSASARIGGTHSEPVRPSRRRLPDERRAIAHRSSIAGHEGYLTVGLYHGSQGEIFITMAKQGSTISGLVDSFATVVSLALQHGVSLEVLCSKFTHTRFEPSGWSGYATSIVDYMFRWLQLKFIVAHTRALVDTNLQRYLLYQKTKVSGMTVTRGSADDAPNAADSRETRYHYPRRDGVPM